MTQIFLDQADVNSLVAALLIASVNYDKPELKKEFPNESKRYKKLENRVRDLCYKGDEVMCAIIGSRINEA